MRYAIALCIVAAAASVLASQAAADTTRFVSMTFTEPIVPSLKSGTCPVVDGFCGQGEVVGIGQATETIEFNGGCGGACDLRTITLPGGSLVLEETFSDATCPGACTPNPAEPISGSLNDVVVGGSGLYAQATGTLTGSVTAAGLTSVVKLAGTIHYDP
jgi:Fe-S cluster biogenesis protein NfuA